MKKILGAALVAALALGGTVAGATAASAVPSSVVISAEFNKVHYGSSIDYVRKTFGNNGKVVSRHDGAGTANDYVILSFPTYYKGGDVRVGFSKRSSGAWYLDTKYAYWSVDATRTTNKATSTEFYRVQTWSSLDFVRATFGTAGTITSIYDAPGTSLDSVTIEWPTASEFGWVSVDFDKSSSGVWKVNTKSAFWGIDAAPVANRATQAEYNKIAAGSSLDFARSTFGSGGTIVAYIDSPGVAHDWVRIEWPTASEYGYVSVEFDKRSSGAWKVDTKDAYWG